MIITPWRTDTTRGLARALNMPLKKAPLIRPADVDCVINWGTSHPLFIRHNTKILNNPDAVAVCSSKPYSIRQIYEAKVPTLEHTFDKQVAIGWLEDKKSVVCRDILNGRGGNGIRIINSKEWRASGRPDFNNSRFYTRYFPKVREVRVHVVGGEIVATAEKLKRLGQPGDYWVRSHSRGWIFAEARAPLGTAPDVARDAVKALGLDFGAADIGIDSDGNPCVFEVNTAPGLEGRTLDMYVNALRNLVRG